MILQINTDGAACNYMCTVIWIGLSQGIWLDFSKLLTAAALCTVGAIGSSPIPNAGIALILIICSQINLPTAGLFPLVLASDLILDRILTGTCSYSDCARVPD